MDTFTPGPGHNSNSLAASADIDVADRFAAKVDEKVAAGIADEDTAERVRDLLAELTKRRNNLDEQRKAEKEPHLAAGRAVDAKYKRPIEIYDACKLRVAGLLKVWMRKKEDSIAAERAAAEAEAKRLLAEAEAARMAADASQQVGAAVDAENVYEAALEAAAAAQKLASQRPQVASAHGGARKATLRTTRYAELTSFGPAVKSYWMNEAVIEVLERLASADARAGETEILGFKILERTNVA